MVKITYVEEGSKPPWKHKYSESQKPDVNPNFSFCSICHFGIAPAEGETLKTSLGCIHEKCINDRLVGIGRSINSIKDLSLLVKVRLLVEHYLQKDYHFQTDLTVYSILSGYLEKHNSPIVLSNFAQEAILNCADTRALLERPRPAIK